jgi:acetylornithine deacetylase/succinyl-diaminopimelate desuccinylase-like protein
MLGQALRYCDEHRDRFVGELSKLVRIPSVSFPGFPKDEVVRSAKAVAKTLEKSGLENVRLLRMGDAHPYVYGDWLHAPGKPTLLLYAHHDVQPPGREELWKSPPFVPTKRGGRLWGRGSADDKAGVLVHAASIEAWLKTAGKLPVNVKVIVEGEEEIGSEHLEAFLKKHHKKLASDVIVLTDTANYDTGVPSVTTTLRGLVAFDVTVRTADHPLHSGMWGGPLPDPVIALSKMIATLTDSHGRIAVPGIYGNVKALTAAERKNYDALRYSERAFRKQAEVLPGVHLVGGKSQPVVKMWREPSISVNAIQASSKKDLSNVVNEKAWCHLGVRTVPDMDGKRTARQLQAHLRRVAPWGAKVEFGPVTAADWWRTPGVGPAFDAAKRALTAGYKRRAVAIGSGGTIPFVEPFSKAFGGAPAILVGVEDPYTNPHSENESLHLGDFHKSIRSSVYLYEEIGKLKKLK